MPPKQIDFTYSGYRLLLQRLKERGYRFAGFPDASALLDAGAQFCLLRHDIDFDLERALTLAEIEAEEGVSATFFLMLRTTHYNVLSREGSCLVERILSLGHHLGLHFDCAAYPAAASVEHLAQACRREAAVLGEWFGRPVSIVSYHRPSQLVLTGDAAISAPLPHTYMPLFTRSISYCSDSRGEWAFGDPTQIEAFRQGRPLHLLIHPIWWHSTPVRPYDALVSFIEDRSGALHRSVAGNCVVYRQQLPAEDLAPVAQEL